MFQVVIYAEIEELRVGEVNTGRLRYYYDHAAMLAGEWIWNAMTAFSVVIGVKP